MKIFLSSTYIDLIEHRKAAKEALERLDQQVGGMEVFGARDEEPKKVALRQLEKCDLIVGIYAHRYGNILGGDEISITEQEFLYAKSNSIPVFCFLVNDEQPWPPKMIEKDPSKLKKLESFKTNLLKEKTIDFFTTPSDLGMKVGTAIGHYLTELANSRSAISDSQPLFPPVHKPTGSTLPSQPYFFGRNKELEIIAEAISPVSRTWGALIDGPGGIGKTALAIKAAHEAPKDNFELKLFITAKVRELTPSGEKPLTDFTRPNYLAMLNEFARELGEDGIQKLLPEDRANALRISLGNRKILVVFDNLETLDENERTRLFQFLSRLPEGNKAIVTSRRRDRDSTAAHLVRLDRMTLADSLKLISELAKNNPFLNKTTIKERGTLYEITNGNPLLITWICSQLGNRESYLDTISHASKFIENAPEGNDPLEYIFGDLLETFTESETKVLAALTYFSVPVNSKWVVEMTALPKQIVYTALEDLANRSILIANDETHEFYLPPLAAQFIKTRRPKAVAQTGDKLINRAYALLKQHGGDNYEGYKVLEAEWATIAAALPKLHTRENNQFQSICDSIVTFLEYSCRWDESIELAQQAEQKALAIKDKNNAGWRAYDMGWVYYMRGQSSDVLACALRAEKYWKNSGPNQKASALRLRGLSYELDKNYSAAKSMYMQSIKLWKSKLSTKSLVSMAYIDLGGIEEVTGNYKAALDDFNRALDLARKNKDLDLVASSLSCLAGLAEKKREWEKAKSLAKEALTLAEKIGRQELIASTCHTIANSLYEEGLYVEGLPYIQRAAEIYTRVKNKDLQEVLNSLNEYQAKLLNLENNTP